MPNTIWNPLLDFPPRRGIAVACFIPIGMTARWPGRCWLGRFGFRASRIRRSMRLASASKICMIRITRSFFAGYCFTASVATMTGDFATADRAIARLIEAATRLNAQFYEAAGHFLKGRLLVERGEFAQGLLVLRDAFVTTDRTGWRLSYAEFKGALALAFAGTGRLDEALTA